MRVVYNKLNNQIVQVINDDATITAYPADYGVFQGDEDFIKTVAVSLELNISQISGITMTVDEIQVYKDRNFCKQLQMKLLAAQKSSLTLSGATYRQLTETFKYAKDAADNGNPSQVKYELEQLGDNLPLNGWVALKQELIDDIDIYLSSI